MQQSWDLMLLAVPDAMLTSVAADLAVSATQPRTGIALHTCGSQGALALDPLQAIGIHTGTLHPLLGFPAIRQAPEPDVVYATDGDPRAMDLARHLATAFEGSAIEVAAEERLLYHYCATLAAGGVSTVLAVVDEIVGNAGLNASVRRGYLRLAQAAIAAAGEVGDASETITGPIARGETGLAAAQLAGASHAEPALKPFLQALHAETGRQLARTRQREDNPGQDPCR